MALEISKISYGGDMMLFLANLPIAFSTAAKLDITLATRDISSKDSGKWTTKAGGRLSWSASTDALYTEVLTGTLTTTSYDELYSMMTAREPIGFAFAATTGTSPVWTIDSTKKNFIGDVIIVGLSVSASDGETVTYSVSLEGTDDLVMV